MTSVDTISIPESKLALNNLHLYGRETEISSLNEAYKRSFKSYQIVWLYGYGGVGKSTLVQHVFQGKENYCYGKFDRVGLAQPYSALVNLVSRICYILEFDYPPISVSPDDASILSRVVPETSEVLDCEAKHKQVHQDMVVLGVENSEWSVEKLKHALRAFVTGACKVICSSSSPLILCLDDLQWADVDSVEIIKALLTDSEIEGLLFIGSYRDNEVDDSSPIMHCMKAIGETTDNVTEIQVTNLTEGSIDCLVADLTQMPLSVSEPLGKLIYGKTLGNAFFAIHMLQHICETNLLEYSACTHKWDWKAENIRLDVDISDNVVDLLTQKLRALPVSTKEALEIAASLGSRIDIKLLESILPAFNFDLDRHPLEEILEVAVEAHLIDMNSSKTCFKFSHDRIQTAAYELTPPGILRQKHHLQIGRQLQCMETGDQSSVRQGQLVLAVDQLNRGSALLENEQGQVELAKLNLLAAKEVITTSAFTMAEGFLETGIELLGLRRWINQYELTLQLSDTLVSVLFSNGSMDNCLILIKQIYGRARCGEDRYKAQFIHVELLHCSNRLSECMDAGLSILRDLGHPKVPKKPGLIRIILAIFRVKKLLRNMSDADLLNLPVCEDKRMLSIIRHLGFLFYVASFIRQKELAPLLACRMMQISLRYGMSELSSYAFGSYGFLMTTIGDFDEASRFESLALRLMERFREDARTLITVYGLLHHLKNPILDTTGPVLRAYRVALSQGDLIFAGQASATHCLGMFVAGLGLGNIISDLFRFCDQLKTCNQFLLWNRLATIQRSLLELTNRSDEMSRLTGTVLDDEEFEEYLKRVKADAPVSFFYMFTTICRFYLGDIESAFKFGEKAWRSKSLRDASIFAVPCFLFSALTALDHWKRTGRMHFRYWRIFRKNHRELKTWARKGNPNTSHFVTLLDAELLVVRKANASEVRDTYDRSIAMASRAGLVNDAALANERVGSYFLDIMDSHWASHYLTRALELFDAWGASAKVHQLEKTYGNLVHDDAPSQQQDLAVEGRSRQPSIVLVEEELSSPILPMGPPAA